MANLSDDEAFGRLHAALLAIGRERGQTAHAETALATARLALTALQMALLEAGERAGEADGTSEPGSSAAPPRPPQR